MRRHLKWSNSSFSQANNAIVRTWGERRQEGNLKNHVDLCLMLDIVALEKGICSRTILCWLNKCFLIMLGLAWLKFDLKLKCFYLYLPTIVIISYFFCCAGCHSRMAFCDFVLPLCNTTTFVPSLGRIATYERSSLMDL
jgi:hypothetical protein